MDPDIGLTVPATLAALLGAPPLAFAAGDAILVALLAGIGMAVGTVVWAGASSVLRRRRAAEARHDDEPRPVRPLRVGLTEDPIVAAMGVGDDSTKRARRRRRPIGAGLHTPPGGASPPPT